jgi:Mor family transcriptional regulator
VRAPLIERAPVKLSRPEFVETLFACLLVTGIPEDAARRAAEEATRRFSLTHGGARVYVPRPDSERDLRNRRIRALHGQGDSVRTIAGKVRLSRSAVHSILKSDPSALLT